MPDAASVNSSIEEDDIHSSNFDDNSSKNSSTNNDSSNGGGNVHVNDRDTRLVNKSKRLVLLFLTAAAATVGLITYRFTANDDLNNFKVSFNNFAKDIIDNAEDNAIKTIAVINELSTSITSAALAGDQSFPFVTMPHFSLRVKQQLELSGAEYLAWVPLVNKTLVEQWNEYSVNNQDWLEDGSGKISPRIYAHKDESGSAEEINRDFYAPIWELCPLPSDASIINKDLLSIPFISDKLLDIMRTKHVLLSDIQTSDFIFQSDSVVANSESFKARSYFGVPVYDDFDNTNVAGFVIAKVPWDTYFQYSLPDNRNGIILTMQNSCGSSFSYVINGPNIVYTGLTGDHESKYDDMAVEHEFARSARFPGTSGCNYTMTLYPSSEFQASYETKNPLVYTITVLAIFVFTAMVFVLYDFLVARRQDALMATAQRTQNIVSSLFPNNVQKRMLEEAQMEAKKKDLGTKRGFIAKNQLKDFLGSNTAEKSVDNIGGSNVHGSKPIADLFPEVTIMFADIVGFTAWSSTREPSQVFTLLETLYHAFDTIAHRRRVFKVETVGDCYVAVAGLPDPRKDHALVMARFARDCVHKLLQLTKELEVELGPDTAELGVRVGLHSGPVTAGVLRGERARFQLFGDTMNTCSRIETTGEKNRIHASKETANLLINAGREHWVKARDNLVVAKGKGEIQTYWVELRGENAQTVNTESTDSETGGNNGVVQPGSTKENKSTTQLQDNSGANSEVHNRFWRLVNWNSDIMARILREVTAQRSARKIIPQKLSEMRRMEMITNYKKDPLSEVVPIIELPGFDDETVRKQQGTVSDEVLKQLRDYISTVAAMYRSNPFHNYEHASHVTMSVTKLMSRIIAPSKLNQGATSLHDHTYGITSDPLTQFAVVLSALIHDIDHPGVPNSTLVKENATIAKVYKNKSVAEQNSIDLAWDLLMEDSYQELRGTIYANEVEFKRFRQLLVNTVMATDIMDKDLGAQRKARWEKAFSEQCNNTESASDTINRKATIVIEHLIQASDVAHTMQHWQIYRKWNGRLFAEMYQAYQDGRAETNPVDNWYRGEIGFFDFYIIPLARKLKDCGVFGVSSDEYLNYALQNRAEWVNKGEQVVAEMLESMGKGKME